jgi:signal transduction histidine kinase
MSPHPTTDEIGNDGKYKKITFTVDVALLRELGERLVGRPHIALAELVKNSYDADATRCQIVFGQDTIEVIDDGNGMTVDEFRNFWMRVGTTHKQERSISPAFGRSLTGSKGVGRLSVQFLGSQLEMWTAARKAKRSLHAIINWADTHQLNDLMQAGAAYRLEDGTAGLGEGFANGTRLVIRGLNQGWDEDSLQELARQLWFLQPPNRVRGSLPETNQFEVSLRGPGEAAVQAFQVQMRSALQNWIAKVSGHIKNGRAGGQATVKVEFRTGEKFQEHYSLPKRKLNEAKFSFKVFKLSGRQGGGISVYDARDYFKKYGGVHVYDDGFRLPFYGGDDQDWLRLEYDHSHRLMISGLLPQELQVPNGMHDLPTLGRVFGSVDVSTSTERRVAPDSDLDRGEYLNVQVTRDRLIDNEPYEDLVHLMRWAFHYYANRVAELKQNSAAVAVANETSRTPDALADLRTKVARQESHLPKKDFEDLHHSLEVLEEATQAEQDKVANERILLGALATAGMSAVALEHELGKEISALSDNLERLKLVASGPMKGEIAAIAGSLENWISRASGMRLMFSPLMNQTDREQRERMRARKVVTQVARLMEPLLRKTKPEVEGIPEDLRLPRGTMAGWNAVFQNIFMNSVNSLLDRNPKRIRCYGGVDKGKAYIVVEDTGQGVDLDNSEELFKPFVRRLEISKERQALGLGGVGLGLTIVRMVASSFGCHVEFAKPKSPFKAAIRLAWEQKS